MAIPSSKQALALRMLFQLLRDKGYAWQPQTPDRLLGFRKNAEPFRPLVQWLGLGLPVSPEDLLADGLTAALLKMLVDTQFAIADLDRYRTRMAVSGSDELFVVHDHWPPSAVEQRGYVHYAAESAWLAAECNRDLEGFVGKRVLDLGCSSGALTLEVAVVADEVLGIDTSERSIEWAKILAESYGLKNVRYECAAVGELVAEQLVGEKLWDVAVFNPPMVVPSKDAAYPHRDGGSLGIELPLKFIEFAWNHLNAGGEVKCFATNPIVNGKPAFFDALRASGFGWETIEKRCLHPHFNQAVARKQGYAAMGISQIELWYLHLRKSV